MNTMKNAKNKPSVIFVVDFVYLYSFTHDVCVQLKARVGNVLHFLVRQLFTEQKIFRPVYSWHISSLEIIWNKYIHKRWNGVDYWARVPPEAHPQTRPSWGEGGVTWLGYPHPDRTCSNRTWTGCTLPPPPGQDFPATSLALRPRSVNIPKLDVARKFHLV